MTDETKDELTSLKSTVKGLKSAVDMLTAQVRAQTLRADHWRQTAMDIQVQLERREFYMADILENQKVA